MKQMILLIDTIKQYQLLIIVIGQIMNTLLGIIKIILESISRNINSVKTKRSLFEQYENLLNNSVGILILARNRDRTVFVTKL